MSRKDIVARLRDTEDAAQFATPIQVEAADEIERLQAKIKQLRNECTECFSDAVHFSLKLRAESEDNERLREEHKQLREEIKDLEAVVRSYQLGWNEE